MKLSEILLSTIPVGIWAYLTGLLVLIVWELFRYRRYGDAAPALLFLLILLVVPVALVLRSYGF